MKNTLTISVIVIILAITINTSTAQVVSLGPKIGYINSGYLGDDAEDVNRRNGFSVGGFFNISPGSGIFAIQPEVLYAQKGASRILPGNIKESLKINYLDIPVLFKLALPLENLYPNVFAGPYTSIKVSDKYTLTQQDTGVEIQSEREYRNVDFGGVFGAGLDIKNDRIFFTVDLRYHLGSTELDKADSADDIKNGSFSINTGIGFRLYGG